MAEYVCDRCGEVNPVGTVFCVNCHAFLAWDEVERDERLAGETAASTSVDSGPKSEQNVETRAMPRIRVPATPPDSDPDNDPDSDPVSDTATASSARQGGPTDSTEGLFRRRSSRSPCAFDR